MQEIKSFIRHLEEAGKDRILLDLAEELLPAYLDQYNSAADKMEYVRSYCDEQASAKQNAAAVLAVLFWYHDFVGDKDASTYIITLFGTSGVIESQLSRLEELHGKELSERVASRIAFPKLGKRIEGYPEHVAAYLEALHEVLGQNGMIKVLAGNHHRLEPDQFDQEKELYAAAGSMAEYLRDKHMRLTARLREHCESGKLWFEQVITPEVVDYVRENQNIQTGVFADGAVTITKIPYAPDRWIKETDPILKRHYACHCPFVRSAILSGTEVSPLWCYCSGGFTKLLFDHIFGQELEVEMLCSVLAGDQECRFRVKLPPGVK